MSEKIKVSELNPSSTTDDNDLIMIVQTNSDEELENFKQTRENFLKPIYDEIGDIGTTLDTIQGEVI
jgi:hypothetical protein